MTEYGRIHTDGSRSGGQPIPSEDCPKCERFGDDCGEHSPSWQELAAYWKAEAERLRQPTQGDALQADIDAMESILWVDTIIDDKEAIAKAFACHRDYGYDRGYYDGCAHTMDACNRRDDVLRDALADLLHAVCGEKGFAQAVRRDSGRIYPWPALDLAEAKARKALRQSK